MKINESKLYNSTAAACHCCGNSNLNPYAEATYWDDLDIHFVQCSRCKLIFANPMPGLEAIIEGNRLLKILHGSRGTFSQYKSGKTFVQTLNRIKSNGKLLDVGCAEGFFCLGVQ